MFQIELKDEAVIAEVEKLLHVCKKQDVPPTKPEAAKESSPPPEASEVSKLESSPKGRKRMQCISPSTSA